MSTSTIVDFYTCAASNDPVTLDVTIGYGQASNTIVKINEIEVGQFTNSFSTSLGSNSSLKGKALNLYCTVSDIQPGTDQTSITIAITGGACPYNGAMSKTVSTSGVAFYTATIYFV